MAARYLFDETRSTTSDNLRGCPRTVFVVLCAPVRGTSGEATQLTESICRWGTNLHWNAPLWQKAVGWLVVESFWFGFILERVEWVTITEPWAVASWCDSLICVDKYWHADWMGRTERYLNISLDRDCRDRPGMSKVFGRRTAPAAGWRWTKKLLVGFIYLLEEAASLFDRAGHL